MSSYLEPFPRFIDPTAIRNIFEIGSRDALDAIALDNYYKPEKLVVCEANPAAQELCEKNIDGRGNFTLVKAAVSDQKGPLSFWSVLSSHQPDGKETNNIGASSLMKASGLYGETYVQEEIRVPAVRGDDLCEQLGIRSVDLLCMDTQGSEISVLKSFGVKINTVKYIVTEATVVNQYVGQAQLHDINDFLVNLGFKLVAVNMGYWGFGNFLYLNRHIEIPIVGS
jgi:FkbM family methyltransferase